MQIEAINSLKPLPGQERKISPPPTDRQDAAIFNASESLHQMLSETPDVRAEAVALARSLINQTSYPPDVTIRGIANLLAASLEPNQE